MTLNIEDAKAIWGPHHHRIVKIVETAWAEFKVVRDCRVNHKLAPLLYNRTKSNDIFDAIARAAIDEFGVDPAFMLKNEAQTFRLFHNGCCIRFKKGGVDLLGQNIPTQAVMDFIEADGCLPGMPPDTAKLEIIWVANELFTELESIHIVARDDGNLIWEYALDRSDEAGGAVPLPLDPTDPYDNDGALLIKPKDRLDSEDERD
ncbi:MAG: hypothetical protein HQ505_09225 [Nitrosopumilus sp.]|nr:hypothetical protein [Nitrosopumilus sp.]